MSSLEEALISEGEAQDMLRARRGHIDHVADMERLPGDGNISSHARSTGDGTTPSPFSPRSELTCAIARVGAQVGVVAKTGFNAFQNYKYASVDEIRLVLSPIMFGEGIVIYPDQSAMQVSEGVLRVEMMYTIEHGPSGETRVKYRTGESVCVNSKGGYDDKAYNKCTTQAMKYFLKDLFQISTGDDDDSDSDRDRGTSPPHVGPDVITPAAPKQERGISTPLTFREPYEIENEHPNLKAVEFTTRYVFHLQNAVSGTELAEWEQFNRLGLDKIRKEPKAKKLWESICRHRDEALERINKEVIK